MEIPILIVICAAALYCHSLTVFNGLCAVHLPAEPRSGRISALHGNCPLRPAVPPGSGVIADIVAHLIEAPSIRLPGGAVGQGRGIYVALLLAEIGDSPSINRLLPPFSRCGCGFRPLADIRRLSGGVIAHLHPQQLADGPQGQVVGPAAGGIGVEDGGGDLLSVGGRDSAPGGDFCLPVHRHAADVERDLP